MEIFDSLTLRGSVENIWGTQADALTEWHVNRDQDDLLIQMNTGGGKTLVGLLVAQSLVNELAGAVLYVCPTNQLVEQTAARAQECGLEPATYMRSSWEGRGRFDEARAPCITNYAAVFNGRSIFRREQIKAIVFDDAHVAYNIVRSSFTLTIKRADERCSRIVSFFTRCLLKNYSERFRAIWNGGLNDVLFVPSFEVRRCAPQIAKYLAKTGIDKDKDLQFAWMHVADNLGDCAFVITPAGIEISPPVPPVETLPYFRQDVRRVYLTATVPSIADFYRAFGRKPQVTISPKGKSGEAQRLLIFTDGEDDAERKTRVKKLIASKKAAIITSSLARASHWEDIGQVFDSAHGQAGINEFADADEERKLVLAARFDGLDLPGKSCRILALDGVPHGASGLDRFCEETLRSSDWASHTTAIRFIQAFGRIFRSNTDHGVVILADGESQRWLSNPRNTAYFPALLQQQVLFGLEIRDAIRRNETSEKEVFDALLAGEKDWDEFYETHIGKFGSHVSLPEREWLNEVTELEHSAYFELWQGNADVASRMFQSAAEICQSKDDGLSAWYWHWAASADTKRGNEVDAVRKFVYAANMRASLGRPKSSAGEILQAENAPEVSLQATRIAQLAEEKQRKIFGMLAEAETGVKYGPKTNAAEEGVRLLGELLGFEASRPDSGGEDKNEKTGPDVIWLSESVSQGVALELKTDKAKSSEYQKKSDIGQFWDHQKFLEETFPKYSFRKRIIGRLLPVSQESHPPEDLFIVPLDEVRGLIRRTDEMYQSLLYEPTGEALPTQIERWLRYLGLGWPHCIDSLEAVAAVRLKKAP